MKHTDRRPAGRLVTAALALVIAGCGGPETATMAAGEPVDGGTVVILSATDFAGLNTFTANETYASDANLHLMYMPLINVTPAMEYTPALAESWTLDGDTAVVFRLRHDIRWHDGNRTTARDVAFTFDRVRNPETGYPDASNFDLWSRVDVVDSFTVRAVTAPQVDPLVSWALLPIMPAHALDSIAPADIRKASFNYAPIGNGPFRFVEYRPNDRWVFEANPDFPEALGGRPHIDRLIWRIVPENTVQVTEILTGQADIILNPVAADLDRLAGEPGLHSIIKPSPAYHFIGWNGLRPPLDDARVRRALALGIDRAEILHVLRGGYGRLAAGPVGPFHWGYTDSIAPLPFDTTEAKRLLDEAGVTDRDGDGIREREDGSALSIGIEVPSSNAFGRDVAQMIQSDLAAIGVRIDVKIVEFGTLIQHVSLVPRNFDAFFMGWVSDYRNNVHDLFHSDAMNGDYQFASYRSPVVDAILDSLAVTTDRQTATRLLHRLQRVLRDEQPLLFLWYVPNLYVLRDRLQGAVMDERGLFVNVHDWWLSDGGPTN